MINAYDKLFTQKTSDIKGFCNSLSAQKGKRSSQYLNLINDFLTAAQQGNADTQQKLSLCCNYWMARKSTPENLNPKFYSEREKVDAVFSQLSADIMDIYRQRISGCQTIGKLDDLFYEVCEMVPLLPPSLTQVENSISKCNTLYLECRKLVEFNSKFASMEEGSSRKKILRPVLSIDGGGIRGIIPALVLTEIEKITHQPISKLFKLIGGTSTGGLLTAGLTIPDPSQPNKPLYSAQDMLNMYLNESSDIFDKNPDYCKPPDHLAFGEKIKFSLNNSCYLSPQGLFARKFGNVCMSSALTDVLITTNEVDRVLEKTLHLGGLGAINILNIGASLLSGETASIYSSSSLPKSLQVFTRDGLKTISYSLSTVGKTFNLYESRPYTLTTVENNPYPMVTAVAATSAAPTFFPPIYIGQKKWVDGGMLENKPTIPLLLESFDKGWQRDEIFMLSLGTGVSRAQPKLSADSNLQLWFDFTQPDEESEDVICDMLKQGYYHRFQYYFNKGCPPLDAHEEIPTLAEAGKALVEENEDIILSICKVLAPEEF